MRQILNGFRGQEDRVLPALLIDADMLLMDFGDDEEHAVAAERPLLENPPDRQSERIPVEGKGHF